MSSLGDSEITAEGKIFQVHAKVNNLEEAARYLLLIPIHSADNAFKFLPIFTTGQDKQKTAVIKKGLLLIVLEKRDITKRDGIVYWSDKLQIPSKG